MPLFASEAVTAITVVEPRMRWVVDFDVIVNGGCNVFAYARGLKFDLAQIENVLEGLLEGRLGMAPLSVRHDMGNLADCLTLVSDLMVYGQNAIDIRELKAMSVLDGGIIPFKNFLYGVWTKYTNRCNLAKVGQFWDNGAAIKAREVVYRSPIEREVISARGTIFSGRWVHRRTGKPMVIGDEYIFSHVSEWNFASEADAIHMELLEERMSPTSVVLPVIDLTADDDDHPSDEEESIRDDENGLSLIAQALESLVSQEEGTL
jgi:hypothetical protein